MKGELRAKMSITILGHYISKLLFPVEENDVNCLIICLRSDWCLVVALRMPVLFISKAKLFCSILLCTSRVILTTQIFYPLGITCFY